MNYCSECGAGVEGDESYCPECGSEINEPATTEKGSQDNEGKDNVDAQKDVSERKPREDEEHCRECGEVVKIERELCPNCGVPKKQEKERKKIVLRETEKDRPIAGGLVLIFAGFLLAYIPFYTLNNFAFTGGTGELIGLVGLVFAFFVFLSGVAAIKYPQISTLTGLTGIVMSILSLVGGTFGGMGFGTFTGVVGGSICVVWSATDPEISIKKWVAVTLLIGGIPFVFALQYWWTTLELLAFWFALGASAPFFVIGGVIAFVAYS